MSWAVTNWIILEGRAIRENVLSGGSTFLNYPIMQFLSYVEFILREDEDTDKYLTDLYDLALMHEPNENRRQAIMEAMAAFGGD